MKSFSDSEIARVTHEANRAYCIALGDFSQHHWDQAPQWQRDSAIAGVAAKRANPLMSAEDQHASWLTHKADDGWTYGEVKDAEAKTHPCMVPYRELPQEQQIKDKIFTGIVSSMLGIHG